MEQGHNIARTAALLAGLGNGVGGATVNRFCASGLEAVAAAAQRIACGSCDVMVAGGVESMSRVPFMGGTLRPNPLLAAERPEVYLGMGLCVEQLARRYGITREACDALSFESHRRALAAQAEGRFDAETVPVETEVQETDADGCSVMRSVRVSQDEGPRADTSVERLAGLRSAFCEGGVITAGNASQVSDGAAALVLADAGTARAAGASAMLRFVGYSCAATAPEDFGIGPALAIPKLLHRTGVPLADVDLIEFNEAFAAQVLCSMREYPLDWDRVNVNGGAIALGHPLGCTGARQVVTLAHEMGRRGARFGMVTMCAALGMGAAGLFERV
jgi:acetyl-CoA acyltransferase